MTPPRPRHPRIVDPRVGDTEINWHVLSPSDTARQLATDLKLGLSQSEIARRQKLWGPNGLIQSRHRSAVEILLIQFKSLIVALLGAAALIAFVTGDVRESMAIVVVILLNAGIGFFTEWRAEEALFALQQQSVPVAHTIRDGQEQQIAAIELVPGDLIVLAAGARIPADGRIVECERLQIEESLLTGESLPVLKSIAPIADVETALGDRLNLAFLGTTITDGRGRMLVTATGIHSEIGKIGKLIEEAQPRTTPLERSLEALTRQLILAVLGLCAVIVLAGWLRQTANLWSLTETGIALAISAVPEGLPAVITMTLALGMQQMARRRALIRRLPAVETLGSVTVICTDKTGTLTRNEMTVAQYALADRQIAVSGVGYEPTGTFLEHDLPFDPHADAQLQRALQIGALCNDARVVRKDGQTQILGDPTEAALVIAAEKAGIDPVALAADYPRLQEIPFDSVRKQMGTIHRIPGGGFLGLVKGSPGSVIAACGSFLKDSSVAPLTEIDRARLEESNRQMARSALRVLGLAYRELSEDFETSDLSDHLTFVGFVGMRDPLRAEVHSAISLCRQAGIRTVMITGDQPLTAAEIARQLAIDHDLDGHPLQTVHGKDLTNLDDAAWQRMVAETAVFARVSPAHKLQIVSALQEQGDVVAMTGDGVNDAPALKRADIGIAMGIKGTDVAKENADMIITDDNFASIVGAIQQGRIIYDNILRFLHYLLSCNLSEILTVFMALMIGWPLPLVALQLLWLNLITDVFPAFALALEPSSQDVMSRPPHAPNAPLLTPRFVRIILWHGLLLTAVTLAAFGIGLSWDHVTPDEPERASTMAFMTMALAQIFHVYNVRSRERTAFDHHFFSNRWLAVAVTVCVIGQVATVFSPLLRRILHLVPLAPTDWAVILGCALLPVAIIETTKRLARFTAFSSPTAPMSR